MTVPLLPAHAGCRSWVDLAPVLFGGIGLLDPVHDDQILLDVADRVRASVG